MAVDSFPLVDDQKVVAAKIETTTGTAVALSAADGAFNAYNAEMVDETEMERRQGEGSSSSITAVEAGHKGRFTFETDFCGDGAAGVPAWADLFLPACGMVKSSGQIFKYVTGALNAVTLTMALYEDGLIRKLTGSVGTWTLPLNTGMGNRIRFEFIGKYQADSDGAMITPTYPTVKPPRFAAGTSQWNSKSILSSLITIESKNTMTMREDPEASDGSGYRSGIITHREPGLSMDPEAVLVATNGWHAAFLAGTEAALSLVVGASNNRITIAAPAAQVSKRTRGNREKLLTDNIEMFFNRSGSTADSEFSFTFA